jgi:hypothetical protein
MMPRKVVRSLKTIYGRAVFFTAVVPSRTGNVRTRIQRVAQGSWQAVTGGLARSTFLLPATLPATAYRLDDRDF